MERLILILVFELVLVCAASAALQVRYTFETAGDQTDASGNGHTGFQFNPTNKITIAGGHGIFITNAIMCDGTTNGQTYVNYPEGWPDTEAPGVHFYEASQFLAVTNLSGIEFLTNGTISFWVQWTNKVRQTVVYLLDSAVSPAFATRGVASATNCWRIGRLTAPTATQVSMRAYSASTADSDGDEVILMNAESSTTTSMAHYAFAFSCGDNQIVGYFNGVAQKTNDMNGMPWIRIAAGKDWPWLSIGANNHDGTPYWGDDRFPNDGYHNGKLDELRIYDTALSAADILDLYDNPSGGTNVSLTTTTLNVGTLVIGQ